MYASTNSFKRHLLVISALILLALFFAGFFFLRKKICSEKLFHSFQFNRLFLLFNKQTNKR